MVSQSLLMPSMTSDRNILKPVYNLLFSFHVHSDTRFFITICLAVPVAWPVGLAPAAAPPGLDSPMAILQRLLGQGPELSLALEG